MSEFSVEVRKATQGEIDRCERPNHASRDDGAAAVLIDGELVAITNEYGTGLLVAGSNATPTQEAVEKFSDAAADFYAEATSTGGSQ